MKYLFIITILLSSSTYSSEQVDSTLMTTPDPTFYFTFSPVKISLANMRKVEIEALKNDIQLYEHNLVMTSFLQSKITALKSIDPEMNSLNEDEVISLIKEEYLN